MQEPQSRPDKSGDSRIHGNDIKGFLDRTQYSNKKNKSDSNK